MGCHTWFYTKIQNPPESLIRETVKERCLEEISFIQRLINDRESIDQDLLESYPEWTPEWGKTMLPNWQRLYDLADRKDVNIDEFSQLFKEKLLDGETDGNNILNLLYKMFNHDNNIFVPSKGWYTEADGFHDAFRKYGYPDDQLFSLDETLAYIQDPKNECVVNERTEEILKNFWNKFSDGMIQFG
jgi:hypothetical protein